MNSYKDLEQNWKDWVSKVTSADALNFAFPSLKSREARMSWKQFAALSLLKEPQSIQVYFSVSMNTKETEMEQT